MKILADLDSLTPPVTGVGHYTKELLRRLVSHADVDTLTGMMHGGMLSFTDIDALLRDGPNETSQDIESRRNSFKQRAEKMGTLREFAKKVPMARKAWHLWKNHRYQSARHSLDGHIYWEPNFILKPFSGPTALTIHDLSFLVHPEFHPTSRLKAMDEGFLPSVEKADSLIAVSEFTKKAVQQQLGVPENRINIVSPAADERFTPITDDEQRLIRDKYSLPKNFILSVGTLEPRKNLSNLLLAYEKLSPSLRKNWPLVCVGARGWNDETLEADVQRLERRGELVRLGYIPQQDLPAITASAGLMAYISVYEGFGMPVAEAMACGVPVLTSRNTSMQEVAGEQAFYTDPLDVSQICRDLTESLENSEKRETFSLQGPARSSKFNWDLSTNNLVAALNRLKT